MKIPLMYAWFAVLSIATNILTQDIIIRVAPNIYPLLFSVAGGTLAGLLVKYILDKKFIFKFKPHNSLHDTRVFLLYTAMGLVTTMIFWLCEFGFHFWFQTRQMRYVGAILGLVVGYYIKYHLDKRYVFVKRNSNIS